MKLADDWIKSSASQKICNAFLKEGHQIYFVGGCVRNTLLGEHVSDLDLATDATPEQGLTIAKNNNIKVVPTGIDHGTLTMIEGGIPFEITTFRADVETHGRHATIAFSDSIEEDARRRDFTMNAIYASPSGDILDPLDGMEDLLSRTVRFIGDPMERIAEDYLRILRFFRFYAWYALPDDGIEPEGLAACAQSAEHLKILSKERVTSEIVKLLSAPNPAKSVAAMAASGVLMRLLPGSSSNILPILIHFEKEFGLISEPMARLATLGGDTQSELRLSKKQAGLLQDMRTSYVTPQEAGYRLRENGCLNVAVQTATFGEILDTNKLKNAERGQKAQLPISAKDLLGRYEGKALGEKLKTLESQWIKSDFQLTREELLD